MRTRASTQAARLNLMQQPTLDQISIRVDPWDAGEALVSRTISLTPKRRTARPLCGKFWTYLFFSIPASTRCRVGRVHLTIRSSQDDFETLRSEIGDQVEGMEELGITLVKARAPNIFFVITRGASTRRGPLLFLPPLR